MKKETRKPVVGYEWIYTVSNTGSIKTMARRVYKKNGTIHYIQKEKYMTLNSRTRPVDGYVVVRFRKNGISKNYLVHRIVAEAHIHNTLKKPFINHKNGIKTDNRVENLEWCTKSENERHAFDKLGKTSYFKNLFGDKNPRSRPIIQKDMDDKVIKKWSCAAEAMRLGGFDKTRIGLCVSGRLATYKTFKWAYQ